VSSKLRLAGRIGCAAIVAGVALRGGESGRAKRDDDTQLIPVAANGGAVVKHNVYP
jgi:hypothetical protein